MGRFIQTSLISLPPFFAGIVTLPVTYYVADGNFLLQSLLLLMLRFLWTYFVLAFSNDIAKLLKKLYLKVWKQKS